MQKGRPDRLSYTSYLEFVEYWLQDFRNYEFLGPLYKMMYQGSLKEQNQQNKYIPKRVLLESLTSQGQGSQKWRMCMNYMKIYHL